MKLDVRLNTSDLSPLLREFKIAPSYSVAFQPITSSSRRKQFKERDAFSSNLQSCSCLYPSSPLSLSPFLSISLPFIGRCNQLLLSEVFTLQTSQAARSPVFSSVMRRGGCLAQGHRATCSRIMHMTYSTYIQQLFTRKHVVFMS